MLEFTILDFVLVSAVCYLCGVGTGLAICCKNKETFLQRVKSVEDLKSYNHQNLMPPPFASTEAVVLPSAPLKLEVSTN